MSADALRELRELYTWIAQHGFTCSCEDDCCCGPMIDADALRLAMGKLEIALSNPAPEPDPTARLTDADINHALWEHACSTHRGESPQQAVAAARAVLRAALTREEP